MLQQKPSVGMGSWGIGVQWNGSMMDGEIVSRGGGNQLVGVLRMVSGCGILVG